MASEFFSKYDSLYNTLKGIIQATQERIIADEVDELFANNMNFFIKSYLITSCTYLEAYLQDILHYYTKDIDDRIKNAKIPHNYLHWRIKKDLKNEHFKFADFYTLTDKKEISDNLSGNPFLAKSFFKTIGIDITEALDFQTNALIVNAVVTKRNNIIHHNDEATDISINDLFGYIDTIKSYLQSIDTLILNKMALISEE